MKVDQKWYLYQQLVTNDSSLKLKKTNFVTDFFSKIKKFKTLNLTLLKNMGRRFIFLKTGN